MLDTDKRVDWISEDKAENSLWKGLENAKEITILLCRVKTHNQGLPERVVSALEKIREAKELLELEAGINWIVAKSVDKLTDMVASK